MENEGWCCFDAPVIEILSLVAGRMEQDGEQVPIGILTARLAPKDEFRPTNFLVTQRQLERLREDIDNLLNDPSSWLFLASTDQEG